MSGEGKPGETFDECVDIIMENRGVDEDRAQRICGALEQESKSDQGDVDELREAIDEGRGLIADINLDLVSGVDVPAIDSKWVMMKSEGEHDYRVDSPILVEKDDSDEEKRISYAAAMIPREPDKEGDIVPTPTVEKAAHQFLQSGEGVDTDHSLIEGDGEVVESWILKEERSFDLPDGGSETYPEGTWIVGIKWAADPWQRIKEGDLTGLSIYGKADRVDLAKDAVDECGTCGAREGAESRTADEAEAGGQADRQTEKELNMDESEREALIDDVADAVVEKIDDSDESGDGTSEQKEDDLSTVLDEVVERIASLDSVERPAPDIRESLKQAIKEDSAEKQDGDAGEAEKSIDQAAQEIADQTDEDVSADDVKDMLEPILGDDDDSEEMAESEDGETGDAETAEKGDDEDDDDEETEKSADEGGEEDEDAHFSKGFDGEGTREERLDKQDESDGGELPSYRDAAETEHGGI